MNTTANTTRVFELSNDYHNTTTRVVVDGSNWTRHSDGWTDVHLTPTQVARARRALCGIDGCTCGDDIGMRGTQEDLYCVFYPNPN